MISKSLEDITHALLSWIGISCDVLDIRKRENQATCMLVVFATSTASPR